MLIKGIGPLQLFKDDYTGLTILERFERLVLFKEKDLNAVEFYLLWR
jgi:hypothetical protein